MRSVTPSHGLSNVGKSLGNRSVKLINSLQVKRYDGIIEQSSFLSKNSFVYYSWTTIETSKFGASSRPFNNSLRYNSVVIWHYASA